MSATKKYGRKVRVGTRKLAGACRALVFADLRENIWQPGAVGTYKIALKTDLDLVRGLPA